MRLRDVFSWPFITALASLTLIVVWFEIVRGTRCGEIPWGYFPFALVIVGVCGEANAARLRGTRVLGIVGWGLATGILLFIAAFAAGLFAAGEGGCFD